MKPSPLSDDATGVSSSRRAVGTADVSANDDLARIVASVLCIIRVGPGVALETGASLSKLDASARDSS